MAVPWAGAIVPMNKGPKTRLGFVLIGQQDLSTPSGRRYSVHVSAVHSSSLTYGPDAMHATFVEYVVRESSLANDAARLHANANIQRMSLIGTP
jgi:hypothetical protein